MKLKKPIIPMLAGLLAAAAMTTTASAHDKDYRKGKYIGKDGAHILLRICESAQTSLLTKSGVYEGCFDWNHISSNVSVRMAWTVPGMPSLKDEMLVVDGDSNLGGLGGRTTFYDAAGNSLSYNSDWEYVRIEMNTSTDIYKDFEDISDKIKCARKVFVHEVGHALKLSHPLTTSMGSGHTYKVYVEDVSDYRYAPYAIMNQGKTIKTNPEVSPTITSHDRSCIIGKWGA